MGLANLYSITKEKKYLTNAIKICNKSIQLQNKQGRFVSFPFKGGTNLHPHCYAAEGLWSIGCYLKNKKFINSSLKGTQWIFNMLKNGKPPRLFLKERVIYHQRVDALAQSLRLYYLHKIINKKVKTNDKNIAKILKYLFSFQYKKNKNKKTSGSFKWGNTSFGKLKPHPNSWVTFFAIQTLYLAKDSLIEKKSNLSPFDLI